MDLIAAHEGRTRKDMLADLPHRLGLVPDEPAPERDRAADTRPDLADDF